jgi:hypothetical protein
MPDNISAYLCNTFCNTYSLRRSYIEDDLPRLNSLISDYITNNLTYIKNIQNYF